jgi:hypothetical protein
MEQKKKFQKRRFKELSIQVVFILITALLIYFAVNGAGTGSIPDLHRIHHSSYQPETDSNFSAVFPIWDIVFGTFKTKTRVPQEEMEIGLEEVRDDRADNVGWLLISPLKSLKTKRNA